MKDNGDAMSEILYESSSDIVVRTDYERCSKVEHFTKCNGDHTFFDSYWFSLIPDRFDSPFISWANLANYDNYNDDYFVTAVQEGKLLYADRQQDLKTPYFPDGPSKNKALKQFQELIKNLPEGITGGKYTEYGDGKSSFSTFICREGRIADYFDIDSVFEFYNKLGLRFPQNVIDQVKIWCNVEIKEFGRKNPPFYLFRAVFPEELITKGLLFGFPLESTADNICVNGNALPVETSDSADRS